MYVVTQVTKCQGRPCGLARDVARLVHLCWVYYTVCALGFIDVAFSVSLLMNFITGLGFRARCCWAGDCLWIELTSELLALETYKARGTRSLHLAAQLANCLILDGLLDGC